MHTPVRRDKWREEGLKDSRLTDKLRQVQLLITVWIRSLPVRGTKSTNFKLGVDAGVLNGVVVVLE